MGAMIYKKQFHKETIEEIEADMADFMTQYGDQISMPPSFDDLRKTYYSDVTYIVLPEREKRAKKFIKTAIDISNTYEIDIEIEEHLSHISVAYYIDCGAEMGFMREIMAMSDNLNFFTRINGYDLVICLDYYTKAVYKKGKLLRP